MPEVNNHHLVGAALAKRVDRALVRREGDASAAAAELVRQGGLPPAGLMAEIIPYLQRIGIQGGPTARLDVVRRIVASAG